MSTFHDMIRAMKPKAQIAALWEEVERLERQAAKLSQALFAETPITTPDSSEPPAITGKVSDNDHIRIYIVWTVGQYANGVRMLDIRAVTTSLGKAKLYSKMLRRDKEQHEMWERVVIEPRVANHLYAEKLREYLINTGQM